VVVIDAGVADHRSRTSSGRGTTGKELKIRVVELEEGAAKTCRDYSVRIAST